MFCWLRRGAGSQGAGLNGTAGFETHISREIRYLEKVRNVDPIFGEELGISQRLVALERASILLAARSRGECLRDADRSLLRRIADDFRRLKLFGETA